MPKLPYTPIGTNVLLRAPNPASVGGIIIPETVKAPERRPVFELCAVGQNCVIIHEMAVGCSLYVKHGGSLWPFMPQDAERDEYLYYCADESDIAAVVN
jgi:co-chaperonin GroES (HSP10)